MGNASLYPVATRPVAMGTNGMVVSAHAHASLAGLRVLDDGGNAFDAAVAVGVTLNVVEPHMSGVGGVGVAVVFVGREGRARVLDFSGRAPMSANVAAFTEESKRVGPLAALVPGNVAGWLTLHETYGRLERQRLFRPAIECAEGGVPITGLLSRVIAREADRLSRFPASARLLMDAAGRPPAPGSRLAFPQLAASLRAIADGGKDVFYRGDVARRIVRACRAAGGLLSEADLATYDARWEEPLSVDYRGWRVLAPPPNSSGFQVLQTLKLMERFSSPDAAFQDAEGVHLLIEAIKLCVTDRIRYGGDPDHVAAPLRGLLSAEYAGAQRGRVDRARAAVVQGEHHEAHRPAASLLPGAPEAFDGGMTTHFAVADRDGNVVSVTQTLGSAFGSAVVAGDTGLFLNNMMYWFDLDEASPNVLGPGKRVDFVLAPTHVLRGARFFASMGTPGSWGILQTTPQLLMNLLDLGMDVQQAIEAPRLRVYGGVEVKMEERFPLHVRRELERRGHHVGVIEAFSMLVGGAHGIVVDAERGVFHGGADPRRDGMALGL